MASPDLKPTSDAVESRLKIYFLPNLLTAGNLFCGFVALTKIVEADLPYDFIKIKQALGFILLACIFDLFDGRVARMGGVESPFGREFDSLADLVSFGVAPAFLVHRVVLRDVFQGAPFGNHPEIGWFIASIYLLCGAFRLARFNCLATMPGGGGSKEFLGFPIPSAAGLVASLTLLIIQLNEKERTLGNWKYLLAVVLVFLSAMMVSKVRYPSFKSLGLRSTSTFLKAIVAAMFLGLILVLREKILYYVLPALFTAYLVYGFIRPRISRRIRHEIEEEDDDAAEAGSGQA
ncbi:MAG TPA: CDP-diacylglycerol--serine O-phosphatidyltransferase [Verrucomicrobiae bacterium]|nr:CDP-diacylglycerol--serine O-phosphatidyltransferase [Verrucomicrobiae bacterium]